MNHKEQTICNITKEKILIEKTRTRIRVGFLESKLRKFNINREFNDIEELWREIMEYLPFDDTIPIGRVCKMTRGIYKILMDKTNQFISSKMQTYCYQPNETIIPMTPCSLWKCLGTPFPPLYTEEIATCEFCSNVIIESLISEDISVDVSDNTMPLQLIYDHYIFLLECNVVSTRFIRFLKKSGVFYRIFSEV
jgi:hypothetical protein